MAKYTIDRVCGLIGLLAVAPIIGLVALYSAFVYRAWPFFVHTRIGYGARPFRMVKIRTLPIDTPRYSHKHALDTRGISALAKKIRSLHLDELPQLALVALGRMSLVGPRPEMPVLHETLDPSDAALRTSVRPGCTGLWQISHGVSDLISASPEYDRFYIENRSLRLDLWILGRTTRCMLLGEVISLDAVPGWARRRSDAHAGDGAMASQTP